MTKKCSTSSLKDCILKKIEEEHITPRPHWHFLIFNSLFWIIFAMAVILGARAVGIVIHNLTIHDYDLIRSAHGSFIKPLWTILPLFWISFFLLFLILAIFGLHQTKKGYKLSLQKLIGVNIGLSLLLGTLAFILGDAPRFEKEMAERTPFLTTNEQKQEQVWFDPDDGRLSGQIIEIRDGDILFIHDPTEKEWVINTRNSQQLVPSPLQIQQRIRIVGRQTDINHFDAEIITLWGRLKPEQKKLLLLKKK